ncbi:ARF GTPase-activating protein GIT2-like isoform X1 [Mercenaria mercenaria]|uniref:ARF GTPase-activating protein GIT2-like isoform X1 n=2 Tax=Mercenaria mercenaria TaxID=6596 RepID=UPI00234F36A9|nr:ARF GTPase-activating protein GIT2-like isoform X1 [Mercenaria mercenaria]
MLHLRMQGDTNMQLHLKSAEVKPNWASINRGVLICDECCSVHRSLGRHISQVKSLKKGQWCPTQLAMVQHLASHGANNIWEYSLWDPSQKHGRRKPTSRDQVHPVKADFIRAKYQFLSFLNKSRDTDITSLDDISQQLHSSVRTNNLETVLRLISKGADPNYYHPEKGNCPLHVAAGSGQILQIELLVIYGADPGALDAFGKTPIDYAKAEGHEDIANRLIECQYELTDRLAYYLCGKKPDHYKGLHFIIPEMADSSLDMSELAKQAKKKLQQLSNHLFEELAMDVYDEVDRRENDSVWLSTHDHTSIVSDRQAVPFLPVNPEFSATRNQGRQKLARFNAREFATLIIDILSDAKRRQTGIASPPLTIKEKMEKRESLPATPSSFHRVANSFASDDEPLYDSVASDEDYSSVDNLSLQNMKTDESANDTSQDIHMHHEDKESTPVPVSSSEYRKSTTDVPNESHMPPEVEEVLEIRQALMHSQSEVRQLIQANKNLQNEVERLNNLVHTLVHENAMLREQQQQLLRGQGHMQNGVEGEDQLGRIPGVQSRSSRNSGGARPQSMFEPRNQERLSQKSNKSQSKDDLYPVQSGGDMHHVEENKSSNTSSGSSFSQGSGELRNDSLGHYDNPMSHYDNPRSLPVEQCAIREKPDYESSRGESMEGIEGFPTLELLMQKTEKITKKIQELLLSAQERSIASYGPCADNIHAAVLEMAAVFPQKPFSESVKCALHLLMTSAVRLQEECEECIDLPSDPSEELTFDPSIKTQQVIQCAYDIAKSAKQLVTLFQ